MIYSEQHQHDQQSPDITDPLSILKWLIRFDSVSGTRGEDEAFDAVVALLEQQQGCVSHVSPDRMAAIFMTESNRQPATAFFTHIDVVPTGDLDAWEYAPFEPTIEDGCIYGRGASDMKSGLAAAIFTLVAACEQGNPYVLVLTKGEEIGCNGASSATKLLESVPLKGIVVAESTDNTICNGHRGALWLDLESYGVAAHGSTPEEGKNAVERILPFLEHLHDMPLKENEVLGRETVNLGVVRGGDVPNRVPDRCVVSLDIRLVEDHADQLKQWCQSFVGVDCVSVQLDLCPVWTSPRNDWVLSLPGRHSSTPVSYYTDASVYVIEASRPVPVVICGPGNPSIVHRTNERMELRRLGEACDLYRRLL